MAVHLEHVNLDGYFHEVPNKIVLNELSHLEDFDIEDILYTTYQDSISMIPTCECGKTKGAYKLGKQCPYCPSVVSNRFEEIKPILWIGPFKDKTKWLNPHFWSMLKSLLRGKNKTFDPVRYLADTSYKAPPGVLKPYMSTIETIIGGRGYDNFINNIDKVLVFLENNSEFKLNDKPIKVQNLIKIYNKEKDTLLFSDYLPLINKRLFVMENTAKGNYTSVMLADIIDISLTAIRASKIEDPKKSMNAKAEIISNITSLFENYLDEKIITKAGLVRRHIYGTRMHFTARAVITALPLKYDYDTIHVPWTIGVSTFRPHVLNKLLKRGYVYRDASELIFEAGVRYIKEIDDILKELISENKYKGIPVLMTRNPSLLLSSSQIVYITKFKTDLKDKSISTSVMIQKGFNGE